MKLRSLRHLFCSIIADLLLLRRLPKHTRAHMIPGTATANEWLASQITAVRPSNAQHISLLSHWGILEFAHHPGEQDPHTAVYVHFPPQYSMSMNLQHKLYTHTQGRLILELTNHRFYYQGVICGSTDKPLDLLGVIRQVQSCIRQLK